MPTSEFEVLRAGLTELRSDLVGISSQVSNLDRAIRGGNGDHIGLYEHVRGLLLWKGDHSLTHQDQHVERRSQNSDRRRFAYEMGKLVAAALIALLIAHVAPLDAADALTK